jgi:kinesin family protein 2/24
MGQEQSGPIRMMDKRTARKEYHVDFAKAINKYKDDSNNNNNNNNLDIDKKNTNMRVCIRKRPLFQNELECNDFDVITCLNSNDITLHDARLHSDMVRQFIKHISFKFDRVFNEMETNSDVYEEASPLVEFALNGGYATCLMYGQTGTGKTYTMSSIFESASKHLFANESSTNKYSLSFFELNGDVCYDLLNGYKQAQLLTCKDGSVQAHPIEEPSANTADEMISLIKQGLNSRSTAETNSNATSSRTHAILRIYITPPGKKKRGVLTLGDFFFFYYI